MIITDVVHMMKHRRAIVREEPHPCLLDPEGGQSRGTGNEG